VIYLQKSFSKACIVCIYNTRIIFDMYTHGVYYYYPIHVHAMRYDPMNLQHFAFNTTYIQ
jgi:hypothetical protein